MYADIFALVISNVNFYLFGKAQRFSLWAFIVFEVCPHHIISRADRHALGEFPLVVGIKLPVGLLLIGTANFDGHAIEGMGIRPPHRAIDESVWFFRLLVLGRSTGNYADRA